MPDTLLVTDLDRTLLDEHAQVPECCLEKIRQFTQAGGLFTVATGRPTRGVLQYPRLVSLLNAPLISYNGACIYDPIRQKTLWRACLPRNVESVIGSALTNFPKVGGLIFRGDADLTTVVQPNLQTHEVVWVREHYKAQERSLQENPHPWNKVVLAGPEEEMTRCAAYIREHMITPVNAILSEGTFLEIIADGTNKGNALRQVAEQMNIEQTRVLAIGDSMNDIEMIRWAGIGGAVANAEEAVAQAADWIVADHTKFGIVEFIDHVAIPLLGNHCKEGSL